MSEVIDTSKNPSALQLAQREIEQLKKRISWLESGSIHTCHAECEKPLCVANREIEKLKVGLDNTLKCAEHVENQRKHLKQALDLANREIERLRAIVLKIDTKDAMSVQDMYFISGAEQTIERLKAELADKDAVLNTAENDYWFMTSLLERTTNDKYLRDAVNDCVERMKFRKPMFKVLNKDKGE